MTFLLASGLTAGCVSARPEAPPLTEIQRTRDNGIEVVLLAPTDTLKQTRNYCTLEFRTGPDRHLVDVGTVSVRTTMTMDTVPMEGVNTEPTRVEAGRYTVEMVLAMTGNWQIVIEWDGPAGKGSVTFPAKVGP